jgi:hypothetical protein
MKITSTHIVPLWDESTNICRFIDTPIFNAGFRLSTLVNTKYQFIIIVAAHMVESKVSSGLNYKLSTQKWIALQSNIDIWKSVREK